MSARRSLEAVAVLLGASLALAARAFAQDPGVDIDTEVDTVARVTSSLSELRAGPGLAYRVIHRAERGETFPIQGREATGFWLRVYLPDGRTAFLLGDTADTMLLDGADGGATGAPGVFAPPPLATAHGGLAMTGGVFDGSGYGEIKPALVINASLSLEPYIGLVMSYLIFTVPFCTWMLRAYLTSIPHELEEAGLVDGATRIQTMILIILPLPAPGVAAATIFAFTLSWNEYLYAFILMTDSTKMTLSPGMTKLVFGDIFLWGMIMSGATLMSLPVVVLYFVAQRFLVSGLTAGSVKG